MVEKCVLFRYNYFSKSEFVNLMKFGGALLLAPLCKGAGVRWTPLPQAEAPTEPVGETLARSA